MRRYVHIAVVIAASMILQGCIGVGAWTLGSRVESSDRPRIDPTRGSIGLHKVGAEATPPTATALREQWGQPDRVESGEGGRSEWIYTTRGYRWSGLVLYVVIVPLPLMVPVGSQYVSFMVQQDQIERATRADWAFKVGAYCGFFGMTYGGWGCGAGRFEELQTATSGSSP